ncbi:hypothetical protein HDC91_002686 [Mucilaginibacter sp. AK015]|nr:hypothetical protein [Mucilaginibacter sp. AK015]
MGIKPIAISKVCKLQTTYCKLAYTASDSELKVKSRIFMGGIM